MLNPIKKFQLYNSMEIENNNRVDIESYHVKGYDRFKSEEQIRNIIINNLDIQLSIANLYKFIKYDDFESYSTKIGFVNSQNYLNETIDNLKCIFKKIFVYSSGNKILGFQVSAPNRKTEN